MVKSEDIPAATQLFTPNWIVKYLVQNSLGRLWLVANPATHLKARWPYYIEPAEQTPEVQAQLDALIQTRVREDGDTLSYYGAATLARRLHLSDEQFAAARQQLIELDLIAYHSPLYQVLALPGTVAAPVGSDAGDRQRHRHAGPEVERQHGASIAPGMASMSALSTISMIVIEAASAASAILSAAFGRSRGAGRAAR